MPYTLPTSAQFKTRFPVFADEDDARIDAVILEASANVGTNWAEADYQPAIMYLAAHLLALDASSADGEIDTGEDDNIVSENFGVLSVSYGRRTATSSSSSSSWYATTEYGRRYLLLLRRNVPGIMAV